MNKMLAVIGVLGFVLMLNEGPALWTNFAGFGTMCLSFAAYMRLNSPIRNRRL